MSVTRFICIFTILAILNCAEAVLITEEVTTVEGTNPDGSAFVGFGVTGLTSVPGGPYGSYGIVNDTTNLDILAFAVSNPDSLFAFTDLSAGERWASFNFDEEDWNSTPILFASLVGIAVGQVNPAWNGTPLSAFGTFSDNFGTDTRANLYFATGIGTEIQPGQTISPGKFLFSPIDFASDFVAFGIPTGSLLNGELTANDISLIRGSATEENSDGETDTGQPLEVSEPDATYLMILGLGLIFLLRLRTLNNPDTNLGESF